VPSGSRSHRWKRGVAKESQGTVSRIGPWNLTVQELYDFPLGVNCLHGIGVGEVQRAKDQARCRDRGNWDGHKWLAQQTKSVPVARRVTPQ
jgi:hypothetical protein